MPDRIHTSLWVGFGKAVGNQGTTCGLVVRFSTHVVKLVSMVVGKARVYTQFLSRLPGTFSQAFLLDFNLLVGAFYTQSTHPITTITIK